MLERLGKLVSSAPETVPAALVISGLAYDSRAVAPGNAFFCIPGSKTDGNQFAQAAIDAGASCIFSEQPQQLAVPCVNVTDVRLALAEVADSFYDHPSKKMRLIGVTGTNGKTTTTHLIEHILQYAGKKVALIGTLGARWDEGGQRQYKDIKHTTPQASELQQMLSEMAQRGVTHTAMEVSSHALA
ncbi:MAG: Mur ligase family protein, partial [Terriglobales bacterium]